MASMDYISALVGLIDQTADEETKKILRQLLKIWVEKEGSFNIYPPVHITDDESPGQGPWMDWTKRSTNDSCPVCGIWLQGTMGYVCSNAKCPTGLGGPVSC